MHVDDNTGKTIGQYGQTTIQERKATFHTTCVAQKMRRSIKGEAMRIRIMKKQHCTSTMTIYMDNKQR